MNLSGPVGWSCQDFFSVILISYFTFVSSEHFINHTVSPLLCFLCKRKCQCTCVSESMCMLASSVSCTLNLMVNWIFSYEYVYGFLIYFKEMWIQIKVILLNNNGGCVLFIYLFFCISYQSNIHTDIVYTINIAINCTLMASSAIRFSHWLMSPLSVFSVICSLEFSHMGQVAFWFIFLTRCIYGPND